ncbi:MAG TPA: hypothetical protein DEO60_06145 [Bacteroidales bacterium]|nr:hypothetical protein [Bacteroidales bacterium]
MKSPGSFKRKYCYFSDHFCFFMLFVLIIFINSCTSKPEPYSVLEFTGTEGINNLSKSYLLMLHEPDSINPALIMGSKGDLFWCDEYIFEYNNSIAQKKFKLANTDTFLYVNDKIYSINIPVKNDTTPWFNALRNYDFSELQFINVKSEFPDSYSKDLTALAEIKPDAGIFLQGDFSDMTELLEIFNPRIIAGTSLTGNDYDQLSRLTKLEVLMITLKDSLITDPLPFMPELKQLILTELDKDVVLPENFLVNNKQIERIIIQTSGSLDISLLNPLDNLKELVLNVSHEVINPDLLNHHTKLEVLSVTGDELIYDPDLVSIPGLRWIAFSSNVTQDEFNSFIDNHAGLEVIELIRNDTIGSLQALKKLRNLYGLALNEAVTDIATIKTLNSLKYLSLPHDFLADPERNADIKRSLPDTRIGANEGFCLGSGWLLLLIPLVLILSFFGRRIKNGIKS